MSNKSLTLLGLAAIVGFWILVSRNREPAPSASPAIPEPSIATSRAGQSASVPTGGGSPETGMIRTDAPVHHKSMEGATHPPMVAPTAMNANVPKVPAEWQLRADDLRRASKTLQVGQSAARVWEIMGEPTRILAPVTQAAGGLTISRSVPVEWPDQLRQHPVVQFIYTPYPAAMWGRADQPHNWEWLYVDLDQERNVKAVRWVTPQTQVLTQ